MALFTKILPTDIDTTANIAFTGSNVSLGAADNLHITGGTSGQVLTTDGSGNVSWQTSANPARNIINSYIFGS